MALFYRARTTRNLFQPGSTEPYRISRSKIENFVRCPRCFYVEVRLGVKQPDGPRFSLNIAVDTLLKKEFDIHRAGSTRHPLMEHYGVDAVPYQHADIDRWRDALGGGVTYIHEPTRFNVTGGVDDVWVNPNGELIVVDYKATSKTSPVGIDADWQQSYKRQVEIYQWLFRQNGFRVSPTAYFVYANGSTDRVAFDGKLEFDITLIPYEGSDTWIEPTLIEMRRCLENDKLPQPGRECEFCEYRKAVLDVVDGMEVARP